MSTFRFKKFSVTNERSAMKVNTDGVLLGAAVSLQGDETRVLDVGTGTGTIGLEVAQRLSEAGANAFVITGIDIDSPSVEEAAQNFAQSPWAEHMQARLVALQDMDGDDIYDLILSNPPYFEDSLNAPDERRNAARHTEVGKSLSYRELCDFACEHLAPAGRLALILPADREEGLLRYARSCSLFARRVLRIRTVPRKAPCRIIVEFGRERTDCLDQTLTIQDGGSYTEEYIRVTGPFYIKKQPDHHG